MHRHHRMLVGYLAFGVLAVTAGCSSARGGMVAAPSSTTAVIAEGPTTTPPATTPILPPATVSPEVTVASTVPITHVVDTTPPPSTLSGDNDPLLLRPDGFGLFPFRTPMNDVLVGVPTELGAPISDNLVQYPILQDGLFVTDDESEGFTQPVSRIVCWTNLCLSFGGANEGSLTLLGWSTGSGDVAVAPLLHDAFGVTLGSRWSDFADVMQVDPGGCYTVGNGATTDGIMLTLQGGEFSRFNADGSYELLLPDPTEVTVLAMSAGDQVTFLLGDC